jgi:hypothetical protein
MYVHAVRAVAFDAMGVLYSTPDDLAAELIPFAGTRLRPHARRHRALAHVREKGLEHA